MRLWRTLRIPRRLLTADVLFPVESATHANVKSRIYDMIEMLTACDMVSEVPTPRSSAFFRGGDSTGSQESLDELQMFA
jgi:hypothetical protein